MQDQAGTCSLPSTLLPLVLQESEPRRSKDRQGSPALRHLEGERMLTQS